MVQHPLVPSSFGGITEGCLQGIFGRYERCVELQVVVEIDDDDFLICCLERNIVLDCLDVWRGLCYH